MPPLGEVWLDLNFDTVTGDNHLLLSAVAHDEPDVNSPHAVGSREGLAIFGDLGSGPMLGSRQFTVGDESIHVSVTLDRDLLVRQIERARNLGSDLLLLGLSELNKGVAGRRLRSLVPMHLRKLVIR